ncbi:helix-turn-helix transcriptional regulator [Photobacterium piscicola]|uniref:Helix-turn-helix transcriptional regulator n=1 Tax=Photobacterium piscicola TaxID=1378299 RepID=A0ABU6LJE6_9GAMM|nr:helix-turn-helix transcriptional regulator [Photobacterium piscicola]
MNIKIIKSRYSLKLSQNKMARLLGISRSTLNNMEKGLVYPKVDIIMKISKLTGKDVNYYYHNEDVYIEKINDIFIVNNLSDNEILDMILLVTNEIKENNL